MQEEGQEVSASGGLVEYLSIQETARRLGVSERSVYGYVESGKLAGEKVEGTIMVVEEAVRVFVRKAPGRVRVKPPRWRLPPVNNRQYMTTITARMRPGQGEALENWFEDVHREGKHVFAGTSARYMGRNQDDPDEVVMVLLWRSAAMPGEGCRKAALAALATDLAEVLAWETAEVLEGKVVLHA